MSLFRRCAASLGIFDADLVETHSMNASIKSLGIDRLPVDERLALVEDLWDSIAADSSAVPLTDAQRVEFQKRIEEDDAHPDDVVPWDIVKASTLGNLCDIPNYVSRDDGLLA
jgi:putative addiction module component (TIGR02574 family)